MGLVVSDNARDRPALLHSGHGDKVAIFIAGVQKGGTTTLFSYFKRHPQLAAPAQKEPHFFDDEARNWENDPGYRDLHAWFAGPLSGRLRFDATPIYSFWTPAPDRISRYNPAARIILVFRNPVERAMSQWRMERGRGTESLTFAEAVRAEPARLAAPLGGLGLGLITRSIRRQRCRLLHGSWWPACRSASQYGESP